MKKILLIIYAITIFSCNYSDENSNEIKEWGFKKDNYILNGFLKNNILNGPVTEYYLDGSLRALWMAKNGEIHGKTMDYYPNGKLRIFQSFINGKRNGYKYFFNQNGYLVYKVLFINGVELGHSYTYDSKGRPFEYSFSGYSNKYFFSQENDSITRENKFYGGFYIDDMFLVDSINNETRFMVAKPIGVKNMKLKLRLTNHLDSSILLVHDRISEFDEYIFNFNILKVWPKNSPEINVSFNFLGQDYKDEFLLNKKRGIPLVKYFPDSVTSNCPPPQN
jgi:hypothetical protein